MNAAPDMPAAGLETWSPGRLILVGVLLGFVIARWLVPEEMRVVRFRVLDGGKQL